MIDHLRNLIAAWGIAVTGLGLSHGAGAPAGAAEAAGLRVGWARTEITPQQPVPLIGFFSKRISAGVQDPLTATALALESVGPDRAGRRPRVRRGMRTANQ